VRHTLKKREILRGKTKFDILFDRGKRIQGKVSKCLVLFQPVDVGNAPTVTVAFVAPRTVKRAVDRIQVKRLLREVYRKNKYELLHHQSHKSIMLLFMLSQGATSQHDLPSYNDIEDDMKFFLHTIREKSHT
jgi:ribonuclease P protein component